MICISCRTCGEDKDQSEFHYKPKADRYESECKECANERSRKYRLKNKKAISEQRKQYREENKEEHLHKKWVRNLKLQYGITESEYADILDSQNGLCAICGTSEKDSPKRFAVDHNHETGEVRGVLCSSCNLGIGNLGDSPDRLYSAMRYLIERGHYGE